MDMDRLMRPMIILLILMILPAMAVGENGSLRTGSDGSLDVIVLKNGGVIKGKILSHEPEKKLKIRDRAGHVFNLKTRKIAAVTNSDDYLQILHRVIYELDRSPSKKEYKPVKHSTILFALGKGEGDNVFSLSATSGLVFYGGLFAGIGVGYNHTDSIDYLPFFAEFRYPLYSGKVSTQLYGQAGYSRGWRADTNEADLGGPMLGMGLRISTDHSETSGLSLRAGYSLQIQDEVFEQQDNEEIVRSSLGLFIIGLGLEF